MAEKQMTLDHAWNRLMSAIGGKGMNSHVFKYQDGRALLVAFNNRMRRR